jgi:ribonuclease VapC
VIVDTSALIAVLYGEPEAETFIRCIHDAEITRMSVASYVELSIVVHSQLGADGLRQADTFIRRAQIVIEPITVEQGELARQAYFDFGKGRHTAQLNFGDCFSYALAKITGEPLLFKGQDFSKTDVNPV